MYSDFVWVYCTRYNVMLMVLFCFVLFFKSSGGWVKIKLKFPHFHVSDTCVSI